MDEPQDQRLKGRFILVVEDEYLLAMTLADYLESAGAIVLGPLSSRDEALHFVAAHDGPIDGAILDVNLQGHTSYAVADALIVRGIRFVFTTGYGSSALNECYRAYPRCEKPYQEQALLDQLAAITAH